MFATVCTKCGKAPYKVCGCGEGRCEECFLITGGSLVETWSFAHPNHRPATCYITDLQKIWKSEKLEWMVFELGEHAPLVTFAQKFRELFGEKIGEDSQKDACLKLYRKYAKIATSDDLKQGPYASEEEAHKKLAQKMLYSKQAQVPPEELEEFEKLWDKDAPRRCREYNCELPVDTPLGQHFCAKHRDAGKKFTCGRVAERMVVPKDPREEPEAEASASPYELPEKVIIHRCDGKVEMVGGFRVCTKCGREAEIAETRAGILDRAAGSNLDKGLKRNAESLRIASNVWGFGLETDPNHVPTWTKRQRL